MFGQNKFLVALLFNYIKKTDQIYNSIKSKNRCGTSEYQIFFYQQKVTKYVWTKYIFGGVTIQLEISSPELQLNLIIQKLKKRNMEYPITRFFIW